MSQSNQIFAAFNEKRKKRRSRRLKRLILFSLMLILFSIITVGTTMSRLTTKTNERVNDLGIGQTKVKVEEDFKGWEKKEVKLVAQTGAGYVPGVARVMFVPYILDGTSTNYIASDLGEMSKPVGNKMVLGDIVLVFADNWETNWFYKDGYFYYRTVLYPEASKNETTVLLKKVEFAGNLADMKKKYGDDKAQINIEVLASILQAEGSAAQEWGITVNGSTVAP